MANTGSLNIEEDEVLRLVGLELMYNNTQKWQSPQGPTAPEIARRNNIKSDVVKKKLTILLNAGIVRSVGFNPKRWVFDEFEFNRMDIDNPLYLLLIRYDDDDYERFYF